MAIPLCRRPLAPDQSIAMYEVKCGGMLLSIAKRWEGDYRTKIG
jgi:hypothetical protein